MPKIIDVVPKDVHFLVDFAKMELDSLKVILDNMEFKMNPDDPEHVKANDYLHGVFYPFVCTMVKDMEEPPDGS